MLLTPFSITKNASQSAAQSCQYTLPVNVFVLVNEAVEISQGVDNVYWWIASLMNHVIYMYSPLFPNVIPAGIDSLLDTLNDCTNVAHVILYLGELSYWWIYQELPTIYISLPPRGAKYISLTLDSFADTSRELVGVAEERSQEGDR